MIPSLRRAYSILHVKAVDAAKRVIAGTATTPNPDRLGDIVEPLGVTFTNPMPLLLHHNSQKPVGRVVFRTPTKHGIEFEATLPALDEPGPLKDRIDEAWQSLKIGLIAGVSIGFRGIETAFMKDGGVRFLKTEVLELSLVTVPANADATIHTIKSLDIGVPAASGTAADVSLTPSGVSDIKVVHVTTKDARAMKKTTREQISAFEATRQAKSARMSEIMETSGDAGVTLDAAQTEEYDGLETDVKSIDAHLVRLEALELTNKAAATPIVGDTLEHGTGSRGHQVITVKETLPPGIEFARYAMCLASAKGDTAQAERIAKVRYPDNPRIIMTLKAAVEAGTTTDTTWAAPLVQYQQYAGDFIEFLRPQTIIGKFGANGVPDLRRVPFNVLIKGQTSGGAGYWVGQGAAKPLTKFDYTSVTFGFTKVANIAVITEELARHSTPSAEANVRDSLASALIARMDIDFVDPAHAATANVSPASITNGVTALVTAGSTAANIRTDIAAFMAPFIAADNAPSSGVWIMTTSTALQLSLLYNALGGREFPDLTMKGGTFAGLPVIVSDYLRTLGSPSGNMVVLVNASDVYLADDGQVVIDASREASLQMDDAPTQSSGGVASPSAPVATSTVSMFQTNSIAIRAERIINWAKRRSTAAQWMANVVWTG